MNIQQMIARKNELGLSYEQVAKLSGVPIGTVQKVLGGITKSPRYGTLSALEKVLDDSVDHRFLSESDSIYGSSSKKPGEFSIEDYYALPDDQCVELIDGVFYDMGAPYTTHQIIAFGIGTQIKNYITSHKGSCIPLLAPCDVQLDMDDKTMLQPDVMVICDKSKIVKSKIYGAPDFIVEVLSPSTKKKDMTIKLSKYENAGVKEYWIIDPDKQKILVYNFVNDFDVSIYGFNDVVPIGIYNGKCTIDFKKILDEISFLL